MIVLISLPLSQTPCLKISYQVRNIKKKNQNEAEDNPFTPSSLESETKKKVF